MKLTNRDIFEASAPLNQIMQQKWHVKTSYGLAMLARQIKNEFGVIETVRQALVNTHGALNEQGQMVVQQTIVDKSDPEMPVIYPNPKYSDFMKEWDELLSQEVEVQFQPVRLPEMVASTCEKCHHNMDKLYEVEPAVLMALAPFITVDE